MFDNADEVMNGVEDTMEETETVKVSRIVRVVVKEKD